MACDPSTLAFDARCFACIPSGVVPSVWIYLICQWLNGGVSPLPPGCFYLTDDQGNYILDENGNKIVVCL